MANQARPGRIRSGLLARCSDHTSLPVMSSAPHIQVETKYIPPSDLSLPAIAVQVTRLVGSYMLWVGTTDVAAEDVRKAPLQGRLAKDWACAMPTKDVSTPCTQSNTHSAAVPCLVLAGQWH